jgi:aspartate ammonia-lyase
MRLEQDCIGTLEVPENSLYGIHTIRSLENFGSHSRVNPALIHAFGTVKLACTTINVELGYLDDFKGKADAILRACQDLSQGLLDEFIVTDSMQGGAGTSLNMNVNELLANRALQIINENPGRYDLISPLDDCNLHQSTNDTYPTALKLAVINELSKLENAVLALQESFQDKERQFSDVVKVGRTQLQDAVFTTLGREMSAYAEAFSRDRWRIYKCEERLRVINLGGTAIGTGSGAPRHYIFRVCDKLRELTDIGFARGENLVDVTQNADVFVEVSGILKAHSSNLFKIANDIRFLSSGPESGIGELKIPARQAGSSIMPGKVNPVIPEFVMQCAMMTQGYDSIICNAANAGSLELNPFLPLIAKCILESVNLLTRACNAFKDHCLNDIEVNSDGINRGLRSRTALITALISHTGYEKALSIKAMADEKNITIKEAAIQSGEITEEDFEDLITPEAVCRLGF